MAGDDPGKDPGKDPGEDPGKETLISTKCDVTEECCCHVSSELLGMAVVQKTKIKQRSPRSFRCSQISYIPEHLSARIQPATSSQAILNQSCCVYSASQPQKPPNTHTHTLLYLSTIISYNLLNMYD